MCCVNIGQWFIEVCNRSPCSSTRQPAEFLTGHALQIVCRERRAVGICARGYAPQKTLAFEDQRATYVWGDAPFISRRSGGLTKLFCSQKISKNEKRQRSAAQIIRGRWFKQKKAWAYFPYVWATHHAVYLRFYCRLRWRRRALTWCTLNSSLQGWKYPKSQKRKRLRILLTIV